MQICNTAEEFLSWVARLGPVPVGLFPQVSGEGPWVQGGHIKTLVFVGHPLDLGEAVSPVSVRLDEPNTELLHVVLSFLSLHDIITPDITTTRLWLTQFKTRVRFVGDLTIARYLLRGFGPTYAKLLDHIEDTSGGGIPAVDAVYVMVYRQMLELCRIIDERGLRPVYSLDCYAAEVMADQTVIGYDDGDERHHPCWTSMHATGSPRLTARRPAIQSTRADARLRYVARPLHRWVNVRWPNLGFDVLARRTGSPYFKDLARDPAAYDALGTLWGVTPDFARVVFYNLLLRGPYPEALVKELGMSEVEAKLFVVVLLGKAPEWETWIASLKSALETQQFFQSFLGRPLSSPAPIMADVQATEATLLKILLARLSGAASQRPELFAGLCSIIPLYTQLFYQIDAHIPIEEHVRTLLPLAQIDIGDQMLVEISAGPSWGQLHPVALDDPFMQARFSLLQPATYPESCPECSGTAPDLPTLREHLIDTHGWETPRASSFGGVSAEGR